MKTLTGSVMGLMLVVLLAPSVSADSSATGVRVAGPDRIGTAVAVSQANFPTGGAKTVVLARDDDFADALAGAPLAVANFGPLLLTDPAVLDPRVTAEMNRILGAGATVYILGLQSAVSDTVASQVEADGYNVSRVGGATRFGTAVAIAKIIGPPKTIVLATGLSAADALPAGAAAASTGGVVLLTNDASMPTESAAYLASFPTVPAYAVGGPAAAADPTATPLVGVDRYQTSVLVAEKLFSKPVVVGVANGTAYPDGLAGGPGVAVHHGPLVLVAVTGLPQTVHDYLVSVSPTLTNAQVFGGTDVIPDGVLAAIDSAIRGT